MTTTQVSKFCATCIGLAIAYIYIYIYIYIYVYGVFLQGNTEFMVVYGVYIRFWPTPNMLQSA